MPYLLYARALCVRDTLLHLACSLSLLSSQIAAGVQSHTVNTNHWQDLCLNWDIPHTAILDKNTHIHKCLHKRYETQFTVYFLLSFCSYLMCVCILYVFAYCFVFSGFSACPYEKPFIISGNMSCFYLSLLLDSLCFHLFLSVLSKISASFPIYCNLTAFKNMCEIKMCVKFTYNF